MQSTVLNVYKDSHSTNLLSALIFKYLLHKYKSSNDLNKYNDMLKRHKHAFVELPQRLICTWRTSESMVKTRSKFIISHTTYLPPMY